MVFSPGEKKPAEAGLGSQGYGGRATVERLASLFSVGSYGLIKLSPEFREGSLNEYLTPTFGTLKSTVTSNSDCMEAG
jgi:hypothetical protein